jgi:hypothetical protein
MKTILNCLRIFNKTIVACFKAVIWDSLGNHENNQTKYPIMRRGYNWNVTRRNRNVNCIIIIMCDTRFNKLIFLIKHSGLTQNYVCYLYKLCSGTNNKTHFFNVGETNQVKWENIWICSTKYYNHTQNKKTVYVCNTHTCCKTHFS